MKRIRDTFLFLILVIFLGFFTPVVLYSGYVVLLLPLQTRWELFFGGVVFATLMTVFLAWLLRRWELNLRPQPILQTIVEEKIRIEIDHEAVVKWQNKCEESQNQKESLQNEYLTMINQQRETIEEKQQEIVNLENNVRDLSYEIKTLVQVNAEDVKEAIPEQRASQYLPDIVVRNPVDASLQLKRCISIAEKMTGSSHFGDPYARFGDFSMDSHAIELRRLFDALKNETASVVLLYSPKEEKLLFANNVIRELLGWNSDRFIQDFPHLMGETLPDWKAALLRLASKSDTQSALSLLSKAGPEVRLQCHLSTIQNGLFRGHVVAVLY